MSPGWTWPAEVQTVSGKLTGSQVGQGLHSPGDDTTSTQQLLQVEVCFRDTNIYALLDSGSNVNIISLDLFNSIPQSFKSSVITKYDTKVTVADGRIVQVTGKARVKACIAGTYQWLEVYVLRQLSVPFVLGTGYMRQHHVVLDFSRMKVLQYMSKVQTLEVGVTGDACDMISFPETSLCVSGVFRCDDKEPFVIHDVGSESDVHATFRGNFDFCVVPKGSGTTEYCHTE